LTFFYLFEHSFRRGIILWEANPMSGVFRNIDPPPPPPRCVGVNSSEDERHCSVLYICKYFVIQSFKSRPTYHGRISTVSWSRIHERTGTNTFRFPGIIVRVLILEVSV
jgi:hypothetical protein